VLARARRFWQSHPGAPNVLSTASSFSPPVGQRLGTDANSGYYIDFTVKVEEPVWPTPWLEPPDREMHVATAQYGLGCIERYHAGDGDVYLDTALRVAEHLLERQAPDGGWPHGLPMPHTYWLQPPWISAMAQGEAASLLVRLHAIAGDERFAEAAIRAMVTMNIPSEDGGARGELDGGYFPEEYPTQPGSYVLNGGIFALWGARDVSIATGDELATRLYAEGIETLAANIDRFDVGFWSRYDLFPHPVRNIASGAYHQLHITQLQAQQEIDPKPSFAAAVDHWVAYQSSSTCRSRAMAEKVAFRLAVPRTKRLALKTPWAHRPQTGDVIVLCYHAVSDSWPSRLAVGPETLRAQVQSLLRRGYRGVTFSDAVAEGGGKRVAVTFDDGYENMFTEALPVLRDLGVPGTVFVPTNFPEHREPLSWPGIDHWAEGEHADELLPLDWEQISALADAGWEIGSHTCTHPRLTQLDDETLARELADSRAELERRLDRPCRTIAYPYGDVDDRVVEATRVAGYALGAALPNAFEPPRPLVWPRVGIYRADTEFTFKAKVSRAVRWLRSTDAWEVVRGGVDRRRQAPAQE
jgi:peptidoglycan/xylan/chitin deacetylase (PgdA/CDA1 family)